MAGRDVQLPDGYVDFLDAVKRRVADAKLAAARSVNQELVRLYWDIGRLIVVRQAEQGWGNAVVARVAADLRKTFPDRTGFSRTNVFRMRSFYLAYSQGLTNVPQPVGQIPGLDAPDAEHDSANVAQPVRPNDEESVLQTVQAGIRWEDVILSFRRR
jgi:hypothetical protein